MASLSQVFLPLPPATGCRLNDPWRFTVTDNGNIYTTDAGNADYEEINGPIALATAATGAASANFGFPCYENNNELSVRREYSLQAH